MLAPVTESDLHLSVSLFQAGNAVELAASHADALRTPQVVLRTCGNRVSESWTNGRLAAHWSGAAAATASEKFPRWHPPGN